MRNGVLYMQYSIAEIVGINYKKIRIQVTCTSLIWIQLIRKTKTSYLKNCRRNCSYNRGTLYAILVLLLKKFNGLYFCKLSKSKSKQYAHFCYKYKWSAKQKSSILKNVRGSIPTIGVHYVQYYENMVKFNSWYFCINYQKSKFK